MRIALVPAVALVMVSSGAAQENGTPRAVADLIDAHIRRTWDKLELKPARAAADEVFLRRVTLDLTGVIPRAEEVERFARDRDTRKRERKVDELLASPAHAKYWAQLWTVTLLGWFETGVEGYSRTELRDWLEDQFAKNVSWDRTARALLSATGRTTVNRAANFTVRYLIEGPEAFTTRVTKTFLGVRLNCAQCHDHPFDVWKREDFYGLASFLARTQAAYTQLRGADSYELQDLVAGDGLQPEGFESPVPAKFLNGVAPATKLWRQEMAVFITRYPQFARAFVNRTWTQLLGRGIVHTPDNFSKKNKPSHPELLEELAKDFVAHGYDVRRLIRGLVTSKTYQLSSENAGFAPGNEKYFVYAIVKPMNPWQLWNSMARACGLEKDYGTEPVRFAVDREAFIAQSADSLDGDATDAHAYTESSQNLLTKFSRDYLADAGTSGESSLLTRLGKEKPARQVELTYLSVLGRLPSADERKVCRQHLAAVKSDDPWTAHRDLFYALLNSHEFNFNH